MKKILEVLFTFAKLCIYAVGAGFLLKLFYRLFLLGWRAIP